jgi:hypothetical protein
VKAAGACVHMGASDDGGLAPAPHHFTNFSESFSALLQRATRHPTHPTSMHSALAAAAVAGATAALFLRKRAAAAAAGCGAACGCAAAAGGGAVSAVVPKETLLAYLPRILSEMPTEWLGTTYKNSHLLLRGGACVWPVYDCSLVCVVRVCMCARCERVPRPWLCR